MPKTSRVKPKTKSPPRLYSIAQLALDFELSRQTVTKRLTDCKPSGVVRGYPGYTLKDAAPYILAPDFERLQTGVEEPEEIDPDKLPPDMQKDYWDAQLKKQKFAREDGHLWDTLEVIEVLSESFKSLSQKLRTLPDVLERRAGLDADQVEKAQEILFEAQQSMHDALIVQFGGDDSDV